MSSAPFGVVASSSKQLKEMNNGASAINIDKSTATGSVEEVYVDNSTAEDEFITPWTFSVAR